MPRYDIIGSEELLSGADYLVSGYGEVEDVLSGYDVIGAQRRAIARAGSMPRPQMAHHQQMAVHAAAMQQAAAMKVAQAGSVLRTQEPNRSRRIVLPMSSTGAVAAGASSTITARPQTMAFKPQRVVVPATIAPNFTIEDIKVGNVSQLAQSGSLPAEAFVQTLFDGEMDMDTCQTSQDFVIQLTNISGAATTFRAAVYGRAAL